MTRKTPELYVPKAAPAPEANVQSEPSPLGGDLMAGELPPGTVQPLVEQIGVVHFTLKVKLLSDSAKMPTRATPGSACLDLYAADALSIAPGRTASVKLDIAVEVPEGWALMIYSRSGHGFKHHVSLMNSVGVIDSDYRGPVVVGLRNDHPRDTFEVVFGDRVAQAMLVPVPTFDLQQVDELSSTERGAGGFGSTGA